MTAETKSTSWTEGWQDAFCIEHKSYQVTDDGWCLARDSMGDMADMYGAKACVWSIGRVAFGEPEEAGEVHAYCERRGHCNYIPACEVGSGDIPDDH